MSTRSTTRRVTPLTASATTSPTERESAPGVSTTTQLAAWRASARAVAEEHVLELTVAGLCLLVLLSLALRLENQHNWFWIDEALSVGIASHPLHEIAGLLRQDGSPPLYYLLLHVWMRMFGRSEFATHALSLTFALASIPVGFWAARSLFGRRAGWYCAAIVSAAPFISYFSRETRMYTLVILLSLITTTCYLHVFALRNRRWLPRLFASTTVLLR